MSHTLGKLTRNRYAEIIGGDGERLLLSGVSIASGRRSERADANDRRLVACWNVCDGIDTEYLEGNDSMAHYARRLMLQRDDLLEALERLVSVEQSDTVGIEWKKQLHDAVAKARAAIAKATGGRP